MDLLPVIGTYFEADAQRDVARVIGVFAPDARVMDEGQEHQGRDAIKAWWSAAKERYGHQAEPLDWAHDRAQWRVRARVSGAFPGSPAVLTFRFSIMDDHIARLEISA